MRIMHWGVQKLDTFGLKNVSHLWNCGVLILLKIIVLIIIMLISTVYQDKVHQDIHIILETCRNKIHGKIL